MCSQVENSSTAQVDGPQDAADVVEPTLAGSDVPLPEDGFTHEVIVSDYLIFESRIFNAFSFQALWLMLIPIERIQQYVFVFRGLLGAAFEVLIDTVF